MKTIIILSCLFLQLNVLSINIINKNKIVEKISNENILNNTPDELPILMKVLKSKTGTIDSVKQFVKLITKGIKSDKDIIKLFKFRKEILTLLENPLYPYYDQEEQTGFKEWEKLEKELKSIGIRCVYAEGMYMGLEISPLLEDEINKIASKEFKLYIDFNNAVANSIGGEYPFMSLDTKMKVIEIGEKIITKFPKGEYIENIKDDFINALFCFTDYHQVNGNSNSEEYMVGDLHTEYYPWVTGIENHKNFLDKYPDSKFYPVIKKIYDNISVLELDDGDLLSTYLIVIEIEDEYSKATEKVYNYILNGKDIPHIINVKKGDKESYAVVYRFYTNKAKAENSLKKIKSSFNKAKIIHINSDKQIIN